jgi:hypothetical protein
VVSGVEKYADFEYTFCVVDSLLFPPDRHVRQVDFGLLFRFAPEAVGQNSRGVV